MSHLTHDEFVLAYYGEPDLGQSAAHLASCAACQAELARLAQVLDRVTPIDAPEPPADYESRVWQRVAWRLRGERTRSRRRIWMKAGAAAAVIALAFSGGLLWNRSNTAPPLVAANGTAATPPMADDDPQPGRDRILLVVVGDHFDSAERVLIELTNLTPAGEVDITSGRARAEQLLASNRLYRRTAHDRGEEQLAALLDDLEPVLMHIAHGPSQLPAEELRRIQKRVDAKGLVFKLRVVRAGVEATSAAHAEQPTI